jgi:signal transduction histidine kinase
VVLLASISAVLVAILAAVSIASRRKIAKERALRALEVSEYSARLAERSGMARDLHDSVAQGLGAISLQLELAGNGLASNKDTLAYHLSVAQQLVRTSMVEVRSFIRNLRTQTQQDVELASALEELLRNAVEGAAIAPEFRVEGTVRKLSPSVEAQVIRIIQEAVLNAVRHSRASRLTVRIQHSATALTVSVADDGRGFDRTEDWGSRGHFGLLGMNERAALIGATLRIETAAGAGTRITLTVPRTVATRDTE